MFHVHAHNDGWGQTILVVIVVVVVKLEQGTIEKKRAKSRWVFEDEQRKLTYRKWKEEKSSNEKKNEWYK